MQIFPAFSYPILIDDFDISDTLIKNLEESWDDVKRENDIFIHDGKVKGCEGFYNWVEERAGFLLKEIMGYSNTISMTHTEVQVSHMGSQIPAHTHKKTYLTGYYMVKYNEQDGHTPLVFENPFKNTMVPCIELDEEKPTMWNTANFIAPVKEGQLIIFPSNLVHFFPKQEANDRTIVSFDFVAK